MDVLSQDVELDQDFAMIEKHSLENYDSVDIVFLMNCQCLDPHHCQNIAHSKQKIQRFLTHLHTLYGHQMTIRMAFIPYGNYQPQFTPPDLQSSVEVFTRMMNDGGTLSLLTACHTLQHLSWKADLRLLFHFDFLSCAGQEVLYDDDDGCESGGSGMDDFVLVSNEGCRAQEMMKEIQCQYRLLYHFISIQ
eukprot:scaffold3849_cov264-Ochromonas_danica.AAC.5